MHYTSPRKTWLGTSATKAAPIWKENPKFSCFNFAVVAILIREWGTNSSQLWGGKQWLVSVLIIKCNPVKSSFRDHLRLCFIQGTRWGLVVHQGRMSDICKGSMYSTRWSFVAASWWKSKRLDSCKEWQTNMRNLTKRFQQQKLPLSERKTQNFPVSILPWWRNWSWNEGRGEQTGGGTTPNEW